MVNYPAIGSRYAAELLDRGTDFCQLMPDVSYSSLIVSPRGIEIAVRNDTDDSAISEVDRLIAVINGGLAKPRQLGRVQAMNIYGQHMLQSDGIGVRVWTASPPLYDPSRPPDIRQPLTQETLEDIRSLADFLRSHEFPVKTTSLVFMAGQITMASIFAQYETKEELAQLEQICEDNVVLERTVRACGRLLLPNGLLINFTGTKPERRSP